MSCYRYVSAVRYLSVVALGACASAPPHPANDSGDDRGGAASGVGGRSASRATASSECYEVATDAPGESTPAVGLAIADLPDAARWSDAACMEEAALAPAVEQYREHNRQVATEQLARQGLEPVRLVESENHGGPLLELDSVEESDGGRWIAGTTSALFARDRCGTLHRLVIHHDPTTAIQRTASVCGCFSGGHSVRSVEGWWLEPHEILVPAPTGGALMRPEPRQNHRYALPEGTTVGEAVQVRIHRTYRLLARGHNPDGPCLPPP